MAGEITVVFCSDEYLLQLNKEFLDHDYFTDIITFDYCDNNIISGDIFVSIDRIHYNAKKYNVGFNIELHRVLFHGVLHLIGYNDKTSGEKKEMRSKEDYYLNEFLKN
ncbi:MAG: rRNA maturation RNase YbeY [Mariniphaga sp.]|nr:rRNA maturation RNase YbeY [Mariniphaga sp.]